MFLINKWMFQITVKCSLFADECSLFTVKCSLLLLTVFNLLLHVPSLLLNVSISKFFNGLNLLLNVPKLSMICYIKVHFLSEIYWGGGQKNWGVRKKNLRANLIVYFWNTFCYVPDMCIFVPKKILPTPD